MKNKTIAYIFLLCCITNIFSNILGFTTLQWISKPLLMPCLMTLLVNETNFTKEKSVLLMLAGLFFGWLGDVLLMFDSNPPFFILGLVGFLCGHLFYIFYFKNIPSSGTRTKKYNFLFLLPVLMYVAGLLYLLYPFIGALKIPVIAYAIVLGAMLCMALWQYYKIDFQTVLLFIAGAISFVISDSVLAINKFYHSFSLAGLIITTTYCTAQYLIVKGAIKVYQNKIGLEEAMA
jgi:uncharacterized membrane protein YhhN